MKIELSRCFYARGHLREAKPDRLMIDQGLPKALALFRIGQCTVIGRLRGPYGPRRHSDAVGVQSFQDIFVSAADLSQDVVIGKFEAIQRYLAEIHDPMAQFLFTP